MLTVTALHLCYGDAVALDGVSFEIKQGDIVAIVGANGAGKSSLIRTIAGIEKPAGGLIEFSGQNITGLDSHIICDLGLGQVAEGRQIFPSLSVRENLEVGAMLPRAKKMWRQQLPLVFDLFPRLAERQGQTAGTLSGGEQQMLAIGRCLMGNPSLIMLDEPSLGLAPAVVQIVFRVIETLHAKGMTILLIEQNVMRSLALANRAYVLENGQITLTGTGAELLHNADVRRAYMGL